MLGAPDTYRSECCHRGQGVTECHSRTVEGYEVIESNHGSPEIKLFCFRVKAFGMSRTTTKLAWHGREGSFGLEAGDEPA